MTKEGKKRRKGRVSVNNKLCKGCGYCVAFCPKNVLVLSDEYSERGYHNPVVEKDECIACMLCEMMCPDFAIAVEKL